MSELNGNETNHEPRRGRIGLRVIAAVKFFHATVLAMAGLGTLGLLNAGWNEGAVHWVKRLSIDQGLDRGHRLAAGLAKHVLPYLGNVNSRWVVAAALAAFLYSAVFLVEGIGLWRRKRWAEYLTVIVTASFLPFELWAVFHRNTLLREATFVLNLAIVAYLVRHLAVRRLERRDDWHGDMESPVAPRN